MVAADVPREAAIGKIGNNAKANTNMQIPNLKRHPFASVASDLIFEEVITRAQVVLLLGCLDDDQRGFRKIKHRALNSPAAGRV
ncbi:hypothetical protein [Paraburkholderia bengalensis]|uniref:hypothetical protein n=1 Tax=Paraburkholderia bengalensis TaxID=2747562 RepID=UPI00301448A6